MTRTIIDRRTLIGAGLALLFSSHLATADVPQPVQTKRRGKKPSAPPQVYLLRGFGNVLSRGIDQIGDELKARGVDAHVQGHLTWQSVATRIIADRKRFGPAKVILVGHSLGANGIIGIAEKLEQAGIRVDYLATFAATYPDPLPGNIRHAVNFYFSSNGWGRALVAGNDFRGRLENQDFANRPDVGHFNIEKQPELQTEVVSDIMRLLKR